jgi:hypothetical protein
MNLPSKSLSHRLRNGFIKSYKRKDLRCCMYGCSQNIASVSQQPFSSSTFTTKNHNTGFATDQSWSEEWKCLGLGARLPHSSSAQLTNLLFVQTGFGIDQHGDRKADGATKAAIRAVRNSIEFNSIPGVIEAVPGGRNEMLIQVLLGVPPKKDHNGVVLAGEPMDVNYQMLQKFFHMVGYSLYKLLLVVYHFQQAGSSRNWGTKMIMLYVL